MRLAIIATLLALVLPFAAVTTAQAQTTCPSFECYYTGKGKGGDGGSYQAGEPFNPFERTQIPGEGKTPGGGGNPKLPSYVAGLPACKTELGDLRRVTAKAIDAVDHGVTVTEICAKRNLMDQQRGIASIRSAINSNEEMRRALRNAGAYSANDVVAIVLDGEGAKLYVHRNRNSLGSSGGDSSGGSPGLSL